MRLPLRGRTLLYEVLPRTKEKRLLDFCLVETTLGPMIEPRLVTRASGAMQNEDVYDSCFTDIREVDETLRGQLGLNSFQWPVIYNASVGD